jgi:hypothetical protein
VSLHCGIDAWLDSEVKSESDGGHNRQSQLIKKQTEGQHRASTLLRQFQCILVEVVRRIPLDELLDDLRTRSVHSLRQAVATVRATHLHIRRGTAVTAESQRLRCALHDARTSFRLVASADARS